MSTAISAFLPWVLPQAPGCPDILAIQAIRSAAIDFCNRTDLIQRVITADATINVEDYVVTPPSDMQMNRILGVSWQGAVLAPAPPSVVNSDVVLRGAAVGTATPLTGTPSWFFQKMPNDPGFSIYPIPIVTVTLGLTVKVSFSPSNTAATFDDALFNDWVDEIAAGAIERLMMMPGQPFSSQTSGKQYGTQYERAVADAVRIKNAGYIGSALRVMPVAFV